MQDDSPALLILPSTQKLHVDESVAPGVTLNFPSEQSSQKDSELAPSVSENLPAAQDRQVAGA
jgi:hypothetical protein